MRTKINKLVKIKIKFSIDTINASTKKLESGVDIENTKLGFLIDDKGELFNISDNIKYQDASFYRYPKLTLPRDKFQSIKDKYNAKVTRKKDNADYKIISESFINSLLENNYYGYMNYISSEDYNNLINELNNSSLLSEDMFNKLNSILKTPAYKYKIDINYNYWDNPPQHVQNMHNKFSNLINTIKPENGDRYSIIDNVEEFKDLYYSNNLVYDSDIIEHLSSDSVVLDNDAFKNLESIFSNDDNDNISLGLEMMANCNIEKSKDIIAYMFWFYNQNMRYAKNWNHVNVKTLKKYCDKYIRGVDYNRTWGYKSIIKFMKDDNIATDYILSKIKSKFYHNVIKTWVLNGSPYTLELDSVSLKENPVD